MNSETYQFYKSLGICTHCRKNKAEPGKTLCLDCLVRNRTYKKKYNPENQRRINKTKRQYRKEQGLCVNCGCRPQYHGLLCSKCYSTVLKRKERQKNNLSRSELPKHGTCYCCCKNPVMDGKKVCKSCYDARLKSIRKICYWTKEEKNASSFANG